MIEMNVCQKWRRYLENACVSVRTTSIHSHRSWSLPPSWHLRTDRQTTWPGEQRRGKRAVSLGQQQLQQQQLQQSWYNRVIEQLFSNSHGVETTIPFSTLVRPKWGMNNKLLTPCRGSQVADGWFWEAPSPLALSKRCTWNTSQCLLTSPTPSSEIWS